MRAVVIPMFGDPDVLEVRQLPDPRPSLGQVAIRVAYAGVNYAEIMARRGKYHIEKLPFVPGMEVAGHILMLGEGVQGLQVGQPVAALTMGGGYAEVALARAALTFPLEGRGSSIDLVTAAGFPMIVPTAYDLLVHVARLQAGETVLIHAAAGGVGTVTGQLAHSLGARLVLGTVGSTGKLTYASSFGYDQVFLREGFVQAVREATEGRGVDMVLDPSGEPVRSQSLGVLAPFGRLVVFGNASERPEVPLSPNALLAENKAVMGYSMSALSTSAPESLATTARQALALGSNGAYPHRYHSDSPTRAGGSSPSPDGGTNYHRQGAPVGAGLVRDHRKELRTHLVADAVGFRDEQSGTSACETGKEQMQAACYEHIGPAQEVLTVGEMPTPEAHPGEVRFRIYSSGINPSDKKRRGRWRGGRMEFERIIPHSDGAGVIESVGEGVSMWRDLTMRSRRKNLETDPPRSVQKPRPILS